MENDNKSSVKAPENKEKAKSATPPLTYGPNYTGEKGRDERKLKRLELIKLVIKYCFLALGAFLLISILDLALFQKDIYNAPVFIIFITVIATTLTTAVGVVIGSSID